MKILISACLLGEPVRYDGRDNASKISPWQKQIEEWAENDWLVPVCPEILGGLPTPRPPAEIQTSDGYQVIARQASVLTNTARDVTHAFLAGAERTLEIAQQHRVNVALLAARSPSCGSQGIYDGSFSKTLRPGAGVTVALLEQHGIPCYSPEEIKYIRERIRPQ